MKRRNLFFYFGVIFLIGILGFVFAAAPSWDSYGTTSYSTEGDTFFYNFSANASDPENGTLTFYFAQDFPIKWSENPSYVLDNFYWIYWNDTSDRGNSTGGILIFNINHDNESGRFNISMDVYDNESLSAGARPFYFIINATNDAPNITNINSTYTFSNASSLSEFLNATDEEGHYPLNFTVTFNSTNCTHASWTPYSDDNNCSLYDFGFTLTNVSNVSALMDFAPTNNHVGVYYANVSVRDYGENYNSSAYPYQEATYSQNKTFYYSTIVTFNVEGSLEINASACNNIVFNESEEGICNITIRTKNVDDALNISSYAILRNYASGQSSVLNTSWFHANESGSASNFQYNVSINVTPTKNEIGNWTINFTVDDDNGESLTEQIYVYVEKNDSLDDVPELSSISDVSTSVDLSTRINLTVYDNDLLIPDKNYYNETITFYVNITNQTTGGAETLNGFDVEIDSMPVLSASKLTNRTTAHISFTPNSSEIGDYTINITVGDLLGQNNSQVFNLSIVDDSFPQWNQTSYTFVIWEDNNTYLNLSEYVTYSGSLTFSHSFIDGNSFSSFDLTSGIIDFNSSDIDVGEHLVNITATGSYLSNTTTFNFTVLNINDSLAISSFTGENTIPTTITNNSNVNATEDSTTTFYLYIEDDDLRIPLTQKSFYNESFTVNLTILNYTGSEVNLFNFTLTDSDLWWPQPDPGQSTPLQNRTYFSASFTPAKADVGNYSITINVSDLSGNIDVFLFNLTINPIDHNPNMSSLSNFSKNINDSLYYDVNVTDLEDGNDTSGTINTNFTYTLTNLSGNDIFSDYFNTTTGIFNITFNDTQVGSYHLNLSVSDSGGKIDYEDFWIYVYGLPNITFPSANYVFNLTENVASVLNFTVNHSVGDNLTYKFYVDSISYDGSSFSYGNKSLRYNVTSYGDGTNVSWTFTPNFTDETYGLLKNLTMVVYSSSSDLENASLYNTTRIFKFNITHTNSNVSLDDNIDDQSTTAGTDIEIDLSSHFSDIDYSDLYHRGEGTSGASVSFTVENGSSTITDNNCASWNCIFSSSSAQSDDFYITASDGVSNVTSNTFTITFTEAPSGTSDQTSSGSSSTREVPVSLKILMPDPVSAYQKDKIVLPITLSNTGSVALYRIDLLGSIFKNGTVPDGINISLNKDYFDVLAVGEKDNLTMTIDIDTNEVGTFEINVNATVGSPAYSDWGKMYLTVKEADNLGDKIVFTEEFIADNPECIELTEMMNEAKQLFGQGRVSEAIAQSDAALQACKDAISQAGRAQSAEAEENKLYRYLIIATISVFVVGIAFYSYKRMKLRRSRGSYLQQDIKNKQYFNYK